MLIADASVSGESLSVWSCEPRLFKIPLEKIPALRRLSPEQRQRYSVSKSGSRIHWSESDLDLDLASLRALVDSAAAKRQRAEFKKEAKAYGKAIRQLREQSGLRQSEIDGIEERTIRRIEKGEVTPHSGTLDKLAAAHGMTTNQYMSRLAEKMT